MAKNAIPMPSGGGVLPKLIGTLTTIAVVVLVVKHPSDAADWVTQTFSILGTVVDGLATFLRMTLG